MAENISIGHINKKVNSTKQPDWNSMRVDNFDVTLKDGSSLLKPVFELSTNKSFNSLSRCNYLEWHSDAQSDQKHNYYWIDEIVSDYDGYFTIHCHRDPLATFKNDIGNYDSFIARSSLNYNISITDPNFLELPTHKGSETLLYGDTALGFGCTQAEVSYTWSIISTMKTDIFNTFSATNTTYDELVNQPAGTDWSQFQYGVTNPGQYIKECIMLPFRQSSGYGTHLVYIGNLQSSVTNAQTINGYTEHVDPDHPGTIIFVRQPDLFYDTSCNVDLGTFRTNELKYPANDFRNYDDRFTTIKIYLPFVGIQVISSKYLQADHLHVEYSCSFLTGAGKCYVSVVYGTGNEATSFIIGVYNINTGVPISISGGHTNQKQIAQDAIAAVSAVGQTIDAFASKPSVGGALQATANVANTALETATHIAAGYQEYTCIGSNGSLIDAYKSYDTVMLSIIQYDSTSDGFNAERGRPVYSYNKIKNMGTYVQCLSPSLNIEGATQEEIDYINSVLATGIYYE